MPLPSSKPSFPRLGIALALALLILAIVSPSAGAETGAGEEVLAATLPSEEEVSQVTAVPAAAAATVAAAASTGTPAAASEPAEPEAPAAAEPDVPRSTAAATGAAAVQTVARTGAAAGQSIEREAKSVVKPALSADRAIGSASSPTKALQAPTGTPLLDRAVKTSAPIRDGGPVSRIVAAAGSAGEALAGGLLDDAGSALTETTEGIVAMSGLGAQVERLLGTLPAPVATDFHGFADPLTTGAPPSLEATPSPTEQGILGAQLQASGGDAIPPVIRALAPQGSPTGPSPSPSPSLKGLPSFGVASPSGRGQGDTESTAPAERPSGPSPLEAPSSPAGSSEGQAGTSFIPLVALLALLALAALATRRRLGRGADFRPPVPFVCALERPG